MDANFKRYLIAVIIILIINSPVIESSDTKTGTATLKTTLKDVKLIGLSTMVIQVSEGWNNKYYIVDKNGVIISETKISDLSYNLKPFLTEGKDNKNKKLVITDPNNVMGTSSVPKDTTKQQVVAPSAQGAGEADPITTDADTIQPISAEAQNAYYNLKPSIIEKSEIPSGTDNVGLPVVQQPQSKEIINPNDQLESGTDRYVGLIGFIRGEGVTSTDLSNAVPPDNKVYFDRDYNRLVLVDKDNNVVEKYSHTIGNDYSLNKEGVGYTITIPDEAKTAGIRTTESVKDASPQTQGSTLTAKETAAFMQRVYDTTKPEVPDSTPPAKLPIESWSDNNINYLVYDYGAGDYPIIDSIDSSTGVGIRYQPYLQSDGKLVYNPTTLPYNALTGEEVPVQSIPLITQDTDPIMVKAKSLKQDPKASAKPATDASAPKPDVKTSLESKSPEYGAPINENSLPSDLRFVKSTVIDSITNFGDKNYKSDKAEACSMNRCFKTDDGKNYYELLPTKANEEEFKRMMYETRGIDKANIKIIDVKGTGYFEDETSKSILAIDLGSGYMFANNNIYNKKDPTMVLGELVISGATYYPNLFSGGYTIHGTDPKTGRPMTQEFIKEDGKVVAKSAPAVDYKQILVSAYGDAMSFGYAFGQIGTWLGGSKTDEAWIDLSQSGIAPYLGVDDYISNEICKIDVDEDQVATSVFFSDGEVGAHIEGYSYSYNAYIDCVNATVCKDSFSDQSMICDRGYCAKSDKTKTKLVKKAYKISLRFSPSANVVKDGQTVSFYVKMNPGGAIVDLNNDGKRDAKDKVSLTAGSGNYDKKIGEISDRTYSQVCMVFEESPSSVFTSKFYNLFKDASSGNSLCNSFVVEKMEIGNDGSTGQGLISMASFGQIKPAGSIADMSASASSGASGGSSSGAENRP